VSDTVGDIGDYEVDLILASSKLNLLEQKCEYDQ
jgi:hypothetical protein